MTRLTFLPAPFVKHAIARRGDLGAYVIAGIHNEKTRVWKVNADDSDGGELTITAGPGKDDSVDVWIDDDGSVFVSVSEASGAGASGSTSQPDVQRIGGVFPPYSGGGGETYVAVPGGSIRVMNVTRSDPPFSGEEVIALPASIPRDALGLQIGVMSAGERVGAPTYVNGRASVSGSLAMYTQIAGARLTLEGRRAAGPNHTLYLAATNGALVEVYIDILGWWQ